MNKLIAMAVPILPGKTEVFNKFMNTLNSEKNEEYKTSREHLNVHERVYLQSTPHGDFAIVTFEGPDPETSLEKFVEGKDAFTKWFAKEVKEIHGMELSSIVEMETPELVADSKTTIHELAQNN